MKKLIRCTKVFIVIVMFVLGAYLWEGHQLDLLVAQSIPATCPKEVRPTLHRLLRNEFCEVGVTVGQRVRKVHIVEQDILKQHLLRHVTYSYNNRKWADWLPDRLWTGVSYIGPHKALCAVDHSGEKAWRIWGGINRSIGRTITEVVVREKIKIRNVEDAINLTKLINVILSPNDRSKKVLSNTATRIRNNTWQVGLSPDDPKAQYYEVVVDKNERIRSLKRIARRR